MKKAFELGFYVTFGAGIAFGISSFTIISELFKVASTFWLVVSILLRVGIVIILVSSIDDFFIDLRYWLWRLAHWRRSSIRNRSP